MPSANPFRIGVAFAITVAVGYTACAIVFWLWPEAAANFMNALFHGLDFRKLQVGPAPFNFAGFAMAFVVMTVWAFVLGTFFGWVLDWLGGTR
ncbi:MAG: hypothetical protein A3D95_12375 [Betaproteobacteria bacterium RIFCSPHIGHO2_12_FULL_69_13]|nr:MAG: hypothetical protein A3D95_12375 [Betaproteobacteria bacterium RIFCSPHIGHO2_12_FULL_69_13]OGA68456.1 MAG: hypothetical protein A3G83_14090 [Betaproteobacteria bacterium RIFCSPLOWO2_12_FULL_68_20]